MLVLGIETSCDETAAAVLKDGRRLLSNVIFDQTDIHSRFGGVVPELAGRSHIDRIHHVIDKALSDAGVEAHDIDLIAATRGPGLVGSLLVGLNAAKGLAYGLKKPLVGINHLEGHLLAIFLEEDVAFPYLALGVSGGHTDLYVVEGFGRYTQLGRTRDDAAGESFDKVARMLELGYPGGPVIEKLARSGNAAACGFPRAWLEKGSFDFSFSGLKTAVRTQIEKRKQSRDRTLSDADIAASFQAAVVEVLVKKCIAACETKDLSRIVVTGGVAANGALRAAVKAEADQRGYRVFIPSPKNCTDNAAMIACAAHHRHQSGNLPESAPYELDARATLPLENSN